MKFISKRMCLLILGLLTFTVVFTLSFRVYLDRKLKAYEIASEADAAPEETLEQLIIPEDPAPSEDTRDAATLQDLTTELQELDGQITAYLNGNRGISTRDKYERIAELWNQELNRISNVITSHLEESEKDAFHESEKEFLQSRNLEAMKEISNTKSGMTENLDYLRKYAELTRLRCYDLLKDYKAFL